MENLDCWLEKLASDTGQKESQGQFALDPEGCQRAGMLVHGLAEVPLLVFAAAVEGGSRRFALAGESSLTLSWDGQCGPTLSTALTTLQRHRVDFEARPHSLSLPAVFRDFLTPLWHRCQFAPISVRWDGQEVARPQARDIRYQLSPSKHPRLVVVDRGLAFQLPVALPGWDIVIWSAEPLPGNPWPMQLRWSGALQSLLKRTLSEAISRYNGVHAR